jgi:hypothetical protein
VDPESLRHPPTPVYRVTPITLVEDELFSLSRALFSRWRSW